MSMTLEDQLRDYGDHYESALRVIDIDEVLSKPIGDGPVRPLQPLRAQRRLWLVAVAAAAAVLVLVGGASLLLQVTGPDAPVADTVVPTTLTESTPTTLAESVPTTLPDPPSSFTWSRVPHDEAVFGGVGGQGMSSVTVGGPGLVAVGYDQPGDDVPSGRAQDAVVWASVDGVTWSRVPHDVTLFGGTGNQRMYSVTAAGAGLVAVGADGGFYGTRPDAVVWTSVDGVTWSRVPHDEAVFGGAEMHSVTVTGAGLVAVGDESEAVESGDSVLVWVAEPDD